MSPQSFQAALQYLYASLWSYAWLVVPNILLHGRRSAQERGRAQAWAFWSPDWQSLQTCGNSEAYNIRCSFCWSCHLCSIADAQCSFPSSTQNQRITTWLFNVDSVFYAHEGDDNDDDDDIDEALRYAQFEVGKYVLDSEEQFTDFELVHWGGVRVPSLQSQPASSKGVQKQWYIILMSGSRNMLSRPTSPICLYAWF